MLYCFFVHRVQLKKIWQSTIKKINKTKYIGSLQPADLCKRLILKVVVQKLRMLHAQPPGHQLVTATICNGSLNVTENQCNHQITTTLV